MKKLKIALTLLLVLCCSLGLYACKDDNSDTPGGPTGGTKNISEVQLSGQKTSFKEGEAFSTGDLKVTVYYQGDDNAYELTADDYEIDSTAYNKDLAGQYIIYVIPKNQPAELWDGKPESKDNRVKKSYYASVDHSWTESTDGKYQFECACGAKRNSFTGLEDKITTVGWGTPATLEKGPEGKTYPDVQAPIAGENHVSYGSLVAGQSLTLTLQITGLTRNDTPGLASAWDSPLMGIRNGADGVLPREDGWVIGQAAGYQVPAECNIPIGGGAAAAGVATKDDALWLVKTDGSSWNAGPSFPNDPTDPTAWSTVVVEYIYQADGVMLMRHTLNKFDGTTSVYTISVNLPRAAYEVCAYGEFCNYTVTAVEFVAGLAIENYEVTSQPTNLVQPAGKLFDTTGLKTKATFSDKSTLEDNFNAYAYRNIKPAATEANPDPDPVKTRVNLATEPLTADMYEFFVEFNGMQAPLSSEIKIVPTVITGANATEIKIGQTAFEAPEAVYDYAVTADKNYIRLIVTAGSAVKATTAQADALGEGYTHFVAFKLLTNLAADAFDKVEVGTENGTKATVTKAGEYVMFVDEDKVEHKAATIDVVVGLKSGFQPFDITLKNGETEVGKVQIDLSGLSALPTAVAEITGSNFTIDAGGTYTVKYSGLTDVENLTLATGNARATVADVKAAVKSTYTEGVTPDRDHFYRASNTLFIVGITSDANSVTVTYWFAAPDLANLIASQVSTTVSIRNGETVLASANLIYNFTASEDAANIGTTSDPVYVTVSDNKLIVYAFVSATDLKDGLSFSAFLNIEHAYVEGQEYKMDYNVGVTIKGGVAAWLDENVLTLGDSSAKLIALGTVNDTTDYDKGAILVASLHLPNIGVRESDNAAQFRFTGNEDTVNGQNEYTIFTVTGNAITSEKKTVSGTRETIQNGSCVTDGVQAYKDGTFFYGAKIVPASGSHTWAPKAGVENTDECTVCHYTREKVVVSDTEFQYVILSTPTSYPDTGEVDWWAGSHGRVNNLSGDFALEYTYTHADGTGDYTNARLQIFSADVVVFDNATTPNITIDLSNASDVAVNTALTVDNAAAVVTKEFTIDGQPSTEYLTHGGSHGESNGDVVARITRVGNVLTVTSTWTSVTGKVYFCKEVISNVVAAPLSVHINGWTNAVINLTSKKGNVIDCGTKTIAEADFQKWGNPVPQYFTVNDGMKTTLRIEWNNTASSQDYAGAVVNLIKVNGKNYFLRPDAEGADSTGEFAWRPAAVTFDEGKSWGLGNEDGYPLPEGVTKGQINATKQDGAMEIEIKLEKKVISVTFRFFDKSDLNTPLASWTCYLKDGVNETSYQMELAIDDGLDNGSENAMTTKSITVTTDVL